MDTLFSQIPNVVLNKAIKPQRSLGSIKAKRPEFLCPIKPQLQVIDPIKHSDATIQTDPIKSQTQTNEPIQHSDAIVQTDLIPVETAEKSTQTIDSYIQMSLRENRVNFESHPLGAYKPMYSIPKGDGPEPPLKIGLTLRGKKRKVYYPDDEENSRE